MSNQRLESLPPTETLELDNGLSLLTRVKLLLTVNRADFSIKPLDEWLLKSSLCNFLKTSSIVVTEADIQLRRFKDIKKRKREDPVADGALFIRDSNSLTKALPSQASDVSDVMALERKFLDWRRSLVKKMDGIELNLEGTKFKLTVSMPKSDDLEGMRKEWEEFYAFGSRGHIRGGKHAPDTIVVRGLPSRWFAEPRVSAKPSMLVTHTIFSTFGKIRNINVAEDHDLGKNGDEDILDIVSGLQCKIVVQFEKEKDFCNALRVLCGRSMQKEGSSLRADYEVTWDKNEVFRNSRNESSQEKSSRLSTLPFSRDYRNEAPRNLFRQNLSGLSPENSRPKRFKE
ncbi:uncharacterized protein LOC124945190 [Impatiens glandulifera]|uniref:uncharacterized protein LOC124945190 n=1 Tax=Impatiens glandulifera TaxID=253017 RepID=UPI001FB134BD|nr:uncharacterized protein LOC124945190 [Impatiens glandulifera]